jgi:hypothetical protein
MPNLGTAAKAVVAMLLAGLTALYAALNGPNGSVTDAEWVTIGIAIVTALAVYIVPNAPQSVDTAGAARARRRA